MSTSILSAIVAAMSSLLILYYFNMCSNKIYDTCCWTHWNEVRWGGVWWIISVYFFSVFYFVFGVRENNLPIAIRHGILEYRAPRIAALRHICTLFRPQHRRTTLAIAEWSCHQSIRALPHRRHRSSSMHWQLARVSPGSCYWCYC